MRIYSNFRDAWGEIKRDLKEMGIRVTTTSMQNKNIYGDPDFATLELQNYIFTVSHPDARDLSPSLPWADIEFNERMSGQPINPGAAWKERQEIWAEFLVDGPRGKEFDYTYSERFHDCDLVNALIANIIADPQSRQHFISVWRPEDLHKGLGEKRIPCTIGYLFQIRDEKINVTYLQRSADFATHLMNDIYLCYRFSRDISERVGIEMGTYTHFIASLHIYEKDVEGVF